MGNLTRDPKMSYLRNQGVVTEFALACTRKYYGQDKQLKEETCFIDCRAFGKLGENISKFCKKGNPLFIEGRLTFDSWTAKDGSKHSKHSVTVENFQLLGKPNTKTESDSQSTANESGDDLNQASPV